MIPEKEQGKKVFLVWTGKENKPEMKFHRLVLDKCLSYAAPSECGDGSLFDNRLIFGDNLAGLQAIESEFSGKIKCIYLDPPYNTGQIFEHYEDGLDHAAWLSFMQARLFLLKKLLCDDGLIFLQIDDRELAYITVLMDEIFGRDKRVNIICVKMSESTGLKMFHSKKRFPKLKEYILVYRKSIYTEICPVKLISDRWNTEYNKIILNIDKESLSYVKYMMEKESGVTQEDVKSVNRLLKEVKLLSLSRFINDNNITEKELDSFRCNNSWRIVQIVGSGGIKSIAESERNISQDVSALLSAKKRLYLFSSKFLDKSKDPRIKIIFADKYRQYNPGDLWLDIKTSGGVAGEGGEFFPKGKKPEALIHRIIGTCTKPGDWVLDCFAGSGTTGAVAHKMGRHWIMMECGVHCHEKIVPRLGRVIDGKDMTGVTGICRWQGGGGFRYYHLEEI